MLLARKADRLTSPSLRALAALLLGIDQGEQPEASDIAVRDIWGVRALGGLKRDAAHLIELAGEEQGLRKGGEDAHRQHVRALAGGRDRA